MIQLRSQAKINLYLDVLNRRRDGYHNIETIFQTVNLYDELHFTDADTLQLTCSAPDLPTDENNLVLRAAQLLRERGRVRQGAAIHLDKHIPIAAGMAGGSGNAAATLSGLNSLWGLEWPREKLWRLAQELGSDVPYCLYGGTMAGTERGDHLTPLPSLPETWFVLVHPPLGVSSASVYNHPLLSYKNETPVGGRTPSFETILQTLQQGNVAGIIFNRMEIPVFADHPELREIKERLLALGCTAAAMSGSGPTLFGLCESEAQAREVQLCLVPWQTSVVCTVHQGVTSTTALRGA